MFDLIVRNGVVVDGSGMPASRADVAVRDGRIVEVGDVDGRGRHEIDADGHVVTPGFIDGHTHLDAQVNWEPLGTSSCWHGVTSVVMGNCGFTLAPVRAGEHEYVLQNLERAEDIPAVSLAAGIEWGWETFPQYLDDLARRPKGINYATYVGHSALRTWAMGERAFGEPATDDDLEAMERQLRDAISAGAVGLTTSWSSHALPDGRPVASRVAAWDEIAHLVGVTGQARHGIFEVSLPKAHADADPAEDDRLHRKLRSLAVASGATFTFGLTAGRDEHDLQWRRTLAMLEETNAAGGRMVAQTFCMESGIVLSFLTQLPFDRLEGWTELRRLTAEEQLVHLRDPGVRARLVDAAINGRYDGEVVGAEARPPDFDAIRVMDDLGRPSRSVADIAADRRCHPVDVMIDLALERDLERFFFHVVSNVSEPEVLELLRHPSSVMTFSDSGAHVRQLVNSSIHTHLLSYWVRERGEFTLEEAIRMVTSVPAEIWHVADRGLIREGMVADLNVIDPDSVAACAPEVVSDLPGGAQRLVQRSRGILATVVSGEVVLFDGQHTGALPGQLLRGAGF